MIFDPTQGFPGPLLPEGTPQYQQQETILFSGQNFEIPNLEIIRDIEEALSWDVIENCKQCGENASCPALVTGKCSDMEETISESLSSVLAALQIRREVLKAALSDMLVKVMELENELRKYKS